MDEDYRDNLMRRSMEEIRNRMLNELIHIKYQPKTKFKLNKNITNKEAYELYMKIQKCHI